MVAYGVATTPQLEELLRSMRSDTVVTRDPLVITVDLDNGFRLWSALAVLPGVWFIHARAGLIIE
jgi:hypothetical protein